MSFNFGMDDSHKKCGGSTCSKIEIPKFSFQSESSLLLVFYRKFKLEVVKAIGSNERIRKPL